MLFVPTRKTPFALLKVSLYPLGYLKPWPLAPTPRSVLGLGFLADLLLLGVCLLMVA